MIIRQVRKLQTSKKNSGIGAIKSNRIVLYAVVIPLAVFMILPLIYILNHAFKPTDELFAFPPRFLVQNPTFDNFKRLAQATVASDIPIGRYAFNSILVTAAVVLSTIVIASMSGFALSKMKFKGKEFLLNINNIALMFVPVAVIIPRFLVIQFSGIYNTVFAHILPLLAMPVGLFLIKQFIDQIPDALIEAATIDGASSFRVYTSVVIPLIKPALATVSILAFQQVWNNMESSNLFIDSENLRTLAFFMGTLTGNANIVAGQGIAAASAFIMFVPNIVLFVCMQSRVMNTMTQSGIK